MLCGCHYSRTLERGITPFHVLLDNIRPRPVEASERTCDRITNIPNSSVQVVLSSLETQLDANPRGIPGGHLGLVQDRHFTDRVGDAVLLQPGESRLEAGTPESNMVERGTSVGSFRCGLRGGHPDQMHDRNRARIEPEAGRLERRARPHAQAQDIAVEVPARCQLVLRDPNVDVKDGVNEHDAHSGR